MTTYSMDLVKGCPPYPFRDFPVISPGRFRLDRKVDTDVFPVQLPWGKIAYDTVNRIQERRTGAYVDTHVVMAPDMCIDPDLMPRLKEAETMRIYEDAFTQNDLVVSTYGVQYLSRTKRDENGRPQRLFYVDWEKADLPKTREVYPPLSNHTHFVLDGGTNKFRHLLFQGETEQKDKYALYFELLYDADLLKFPLKLVPNYIRNYSGTELRFHVFPLFAMEQL